MRRLRMGSAAVLALLLVLSGCATPAPEVVTVIETVEKVIEREGETITVVETREVEVEVEVEKVVTATPEPTANPFDENAPIEVWVDAPRMAAIDAFKETFPEKANLVNATLSNRGQFPQQVLFFNNVGEGWPDVIFLPPRNTAHVADAAHRYPGDLTPWVPQEIVDGFAHGSLDPCTIEGKLLCMRNDLAQTVLWYNVPLMEEFGYEVPVLWDDYLAIAEDVAANHPGYYVGVMLQSHNTFFWASQCAFVEEVDLGHVRIFDPESEACQRPAQLLDQLNALGVMGASHNDAEFVTAANEDRLLMLPFASWAGEHLFGGRENSLYYKSGEGQLGVAPSPKWPDQDQAWSGAIGGGAWAMSRYTKNPQLSAELVVWLTTSEEFQGATATTFPAYLPAAEIWAERVADNPVYAFDPYPVLEEAAGRIWTVSTEGRYQDFVTQTYAEFVLNPATSGEQTFVEGLPAMREELINLAPTLGFEVLE